MGRQCQLTKKKPVAGRSYSIRGIAKKKKGIGLNITGKTRRRFVPNLVKKKFYLPNEGRFVTLSLSAAAIRTVNKIGIEAAVKQMRASGEKI
ncbi:MAG: 50S ribosomal protein L28 [Parachlamydiales bacterium]